MIRLVLFMTFIAASSHASIISKTVGQVGSEVITSREALQSLFVEQVLFEGKAVPADIDGVSFAKKLNGVIMEKVVYQEALQFRPKEIKSSDINSRVAIVRTRLKANKAWKALETSLKELKEIVRIKLVAKDFVQFKASSSVVPITEQEAKDYYEENKGKFGKADYNSLKPNITSFLNRRQVDVRLKAWFDVLKSKYRVKNFVQ